MENLSYHQRQILNYGKKLAAIDPQNPALKSAREIWRNGCFSRYSNEDFDIENSLFTALQRAAKNGMAFDDWQEEDGCPIHSEESQVKKSYDFGLQDAEVFVFSGCQCAMCIEKPLAGGQGTPRYYKTYADATGEAILATQIHAAKCR